MTKRLLFPALLWLALAAAALLAAGCGTGNPYPPGSYERADFFATRGKNLEAVAAFESFVRRNPTDSLAAEAQFRKAMTYMAMKEYPLAAVEFQILRKDYPTSPLVEEALFREGEAYLFQVGRVERDITGAYTARQHFREFLKQYPQSSFRPEVEADLVRISDLVVRKRLKEANVYRQLGRLKAVAATLDILLEQEPDSTLRDEVLWERARVAFDLGEDAAGRGFLEQLLEEFPDSDYARRARGMLAEAGAPAGDRAAAAAPDGDGS